MPEPRFKIGEPVWRVDWGRVEKQIQCPDCAGTGRIRLIMADESQVAIPCEGCSKGYNGPTGKVTSYDFAVKVEQCVIGGLRQEIGQEIEYQVSSPTGGYWVLKEGKTVFATEVEALAAAAEQTAKNTAEEEARFKGKYDAKRTWAWNASYHRRGIREAQRSLEHHTRMLATASLKAKEDKRDA